MFETAIWMPATGYFHQNEIITEKLNNLPKKSKVGMNTATRARARASKAFKSL